MPRLIERATVIQAAGNKPKYEALKRGLVARFNASSSADREAYAMAKTAFIERVVQIALAGGYPRGLATPP